VHPHTKPNLYNTKLTRNFRRLSGACPEYDGVVQEGSSVRIRRSVGRLFVGKAVAPAAVPAAAPNAVQTAVDGERAAARRRGHRAWVVVASLAAGLAISLAVASAFAALSHHRIGGVVAAEVPGSPSGVDVACGEAAAEAPVHHGHEHDRMLEWRNAGRSLLNAAAALTAVPRCAEQSLARSAALLVRDAPRGRPDLTSLCILRT
jgi:hypothetical protein